MSWNRVKRLRCSICSMDLHVQDRRDVQLNRRIDVESSGYPTYWLRRSLMGVKPISTRSE